eukprot:6623537-Heterocapsa_arctica.AAC.1
MVPRINRKLGSINLGGQPWYYLRPGWNMPPMYYMHVSRYVGPGTGASLDFQATAYAPIIV